MQLERGSFEEFVDDVYSGLTVGSAHTARLMIDWLTKMLPILRSKKELIEKPSLKVIGVGYGRTGTYSLALALEQLGFPTLHTQHLYENREIFNMWTNDIFLPSINNNNATLGSPDFDLIASHGYMATTDLPMALYFKEISELYPESKFILTTRDNSESWFRSWDVLSKSIVQPARYGTWIGTVRKLGIYIRWLFSIINQDNIYLTTPYPLPNQNKKAAIDSYERHNQRVREVIPSSRLLEYNVKQGWKPLCDFLQIQKCPTEPFPKTNTARAVQIQAVSSVIFPLTLTIMIIFPLFSFIFQKVTGTTVINWSSSVYRQHFLSSFNKSGTSSKKKMSRIKLKKGQYSPVKKPKIP